MGDAENRESEFGISRASGEKKSRARERFFLVAAGRGNGFGGGRSEGERKFVNEELCEAKPLRSAGAGGVRKLGRFPAECGEKIASSREIFLDRLWVEKLILREGNLFCF